MDNIGILLVALLVGVALGAAAAWFLLRRTADATAAMSRPAGLPSRSRPAACCLPGWPVG